MNFGLQSPKLSTKVTPRQFACKFSYVCHCTYMIFLFGPSNFSGPLSQLFIILTRDRPTLVYL